VIVVPIRVNVNLKAMTVEELIARRKVLPHSLLLSPYLHFMFLPRGVEQLAYLDGRDCML
jgi:hypothetical protein